MSKCIAVEKYFDVSLVFFSKTNFDLFMGVFACNSCIKLDSGSVGLNTMFNIF